MLEGSNTPITSSSRSKGGAAKVDADSDRDPVPPDDPSEDPGR
jgi:hypothetical protein